MADWNNRIVGYEERPAHTFLAHPHNARRHPPAQREALRGSLDTLGFVAPVVVNTRTEHVLDGHARIEEALTANENMSVPVILVDLSEDEEHLFLASFDWITGLAHYDRDALDNLMHHVQTDEERLQAMLSDMAKEHDLYIPDDWAEYDETIADDVEHVTCPHCGESFPK